MERPLHIDKAIEGAANGGYGPGVSPNTALSVGLKVDAEALPPDVVVGIKSGAISLADPKSTLALLKLNAVVGVKGNFSESGNLVSVGITCASCHSTVDNSFAQGIGKRLDGWPNRDLNVGAIIVIISFCEEALWFFLLHSFNMMRINQVLKYSLLFKFFKCSKA